jgi:predicted permease
METTLVFGKIFLIFSLIFVGLFSCKIGWISVSSSKTLSNIVINLAGPCMILSAMCSEELDSRTTRNIIILFTISIAMYIFLTGLSYPLAKLLSPDKSTNAVYRNFMIFTNNGFMGFPVALAIFGSRGLFYMVMINIVTTFFIYSVGSVNLRNDAEKNIKKTISERLHAILSEIKTVLLMPPIICLFLGGIIMFGQIQIPALAFDFLNLLGSLMTPLAMIVVGINLSQSRPRDVMLNRRLIAVCILRLAVLPGLIFLIQLPLMLNGLLSPLTVGVLTLTVALPCGSVPVALAEQYENNPQLSAEGTFLSTLFSIGTIPVAGILLSML